MKKTKLLKKSDLSWSYVLMIIVSLIVGYVIFLILRRVLNVAGPK